MLVNGINITTETIERTRNHFVENCKSCIAGSINGEFKVNDLNKYVDWQEKQIKIFLAGKNDHTLTFLQRALWIQTGKMVAILS